jgi:hypothetical protein
MPEAFQAIGGSWWPTSSCAARAPARRLPARRARDCRAAARPPHRPAG